MPIFMHYIRASLDRPSKKYFNFDSGSDAWSARNLRPVHSFASLNLQKSVI